MCEDLARLVDAIPLITRMAARSVTLIGGLAVLARLSMPHRSTTDVDTASLLERGQTPTLEVLPGPSRARDRRTPRGP